MTINLDNCFQSFPKINIPKDLEKFWVNLNTEVSSQNSKSKAKARVRFSQSIGRETKIEMSFPSLDNILLEAVLILPGKFGKFPAVLTIHDYGETKPVYFPELSQAGFAQMSIRLRGHLNSFVKPEDEKDWTPGYFGKNLLSREKFYLRDIYTDVMTALAVLQKHSSIQKNKIAIYGKGIGAAAASYVNWLNPKIVKAAFYDRIAFSSLEIYLPQSQVFIAREIKEATALRNKAKVKKTLSYFDPLMISENIENPVCMSVGYLDKHSPAESIFGFFNHLKCEKDMQIFPDDDHNNPKKLGKIIADYFVETLG